MPLISLVGPGSRYYPPAQSGAGFYGVGHWDAAEYALRVVYPRPDLETSSYARHRWAYYNGVNPIPYEIDIAAMFGAWPHVYEIITAPAWMSIGEAYGDANYGKLSGTPTGTLTDADVVVRIWDQETNFVDVEFTISTSSSTDVFIFIDSVGGDDGTGDGSIGNPYQTHQHVWGLTEGALTDHPNAIVYRRAGTYTWFSQGAGLGAQLRKDRTPMALIDYPGETVVDDIDSVGVGRWLSTSGSDGDDVYLRGLTVSGGPAASTNFRYFYFGDGGSRITYGRINAPDVFSGSSPTDNATMGYFNSAGALRQYIYAHHIFESNRTGSNSGGAFTAFTTQYMLARFITCETPSAGFDCHFKASCQDCELSETFIGNHTGMQCQIDSGIPFTRVQVRHVRVQGQIEVNNGFSGANVGEIIVNRCSTLRLDVNDTCTSVKFVNNAVQSPAGLNPVRYNRTNDALPVWATNTGTECQDSGTSAILNETTMNLIGTFRDDHFGTANSRGAEIG
jgi:hypothetical protein